MKIFFANNLVKYETEKATLIKMPGSMKTFWLPNSLIYPGRGEFFVGYIPDDFIIKSSKSHLVIDHDEIEMAFENTNESLNPHVERESHKPEKLEPVDTKEDEDLLR